MFEAEEAAEARAVKVEVMVVMVKPLVLLAAVSISFEFVAVADVIAVVVAIVITAESPEVRVSPAAHSTPATIVAVFAIAEVVNLGLGTDLQRFL